MTTLTGRTALSVATIALVLGVVGPGVNAAQAHAAPQPGARVHVCPSEAFISPCLDVYEIGRRTYAEWDNVWMWSRFVLTWQQKGFGVHRWELDGQKRRAFVTDTEREKIYTFRISGCDTWLPGPRTPCSVWTTAVYKTRLDFPPDCNLCGDFEGVEVKEG